MADVARPDRNNESRACARNAGGDGRRHALAGLLGGALTALGVAVHAQPGAVHPTRQGQEIRQLEEALLRAIGTRDAAALERLLGDGFEMIEAQQPDLPVGRQAWIASVLRAPRRPWEFGQIGVQQLGEVAIASMQLQSVGGALAPLFIVDVWRREDGVWRLLTRHAGPASGPLEPIPGHAEPQGAPKKY